MTYKIFNKLFIVTLVLMMSFNIPVVNAIEVKNIDNDPVIIDKEDDRIVVGQTRFVDENGNIKIVDVYDGTTGEKFNPKAKLVTTSNMVNFNCTKAGVTTIFEDYYTGQEGYISKASGADAAFLGYEKGKVKFMISGVTGLVDPNLVEIVPKGKYYASNYEVNSAGKLYHYISTNVNASSNSVGQEKNYNYVGEAPNYLAKGVEYYSYDGHYFYTNYEVMIKDYKNNSRSNAENANKPYYNYFQYLPLRSKTNYSGKELTAYLNKKANSNISRLNNTGDIFIKYQNQYGVNALMTASFAALESSWGKSNIAQTKNNLFGLNAVDNNPGGSADKFNSVDACIQNFTSSWMSKRYLNAVYTSLFRGGFFGDKASGIFGKYSSDPYEGEKCASIAANMDAEISGLDKNYYTLGIKDVTATTHSKVNVKQLNNASSKTLYTTLNNPAYAFIIRNNDVQAGGYYEVQSDSTLNNDRTGVSGFSEYNYENNYGYVPASLLTVINFGKHVNYPPKLEEYSIINKTSSGFTVQGKVSDDVKVERVVMEVWTEKNGQDDVVWERAVLNGETFTYDVKTSEHKNEKGIYRINIYVCDGEDKQTVKELTVTVENEAPKLNECYIINKTSSGFTVQGKVSDDVKVERVVMEVWTEKNGQDDVVWERAVLNGETFTYDVKTSEHKNEKGIYRINIYVCDGEDKQTVKELTVTVENEAPKLNECYIINKTSSGFTVQGKVSDDVKVERVVMEVWTEKNGQDDVVWERAVLNGETFTYDVKTSEHKNEKGIYRINIYVCDGEDKQTVKELTVTVENEAPKLNECYIINKTSSGFTVQGKVSDDVKVERVVMEVWTEKNGQDDVVWERAVLNGETFTYDVKTSEHKNEKGIYRINIYVCDGEDKQTVKELTVTVENEAPKLNECYIINKTSSGFTVQGKVSDDVKVERVVMEVWTEKNGQDDVVWERAVLNGETFTYDVKTSEHKNEKGIYRINIYVCDGEDKQTVKELTVTVENEAPKLNECYIINKTSSGFTVQGKVSDDVKVERVVMEVWTEKNGQDDVVWERAVLNGETFTYDVKTSEHKNEKGIYRINIYVCDGEDKQTVKELTVNI